MGRQLQEGYFRNIEKSKNKQFVNSSVAYPKQGPCRGNNYLRQPSATKEIEKYETNRRTES